MNDTTNHRDLDQRIEQLIREHIAAVHRNAREAIDRAFTGAGRKPALAAAGTTAAKGRKRRAPAEVSTLGERLYRAVCARPGERMAVLAGELGASAREMQRPMALLKQAGRVRSVGIRNQTRYFPRTGTSS